MHEIVYVPALVFSCTAALAWAVTLVINLREGSVLKPVPVPEVVAPVASAPRLFRPIVIQGGLADAPVYFRAVKTPLRFRGGAANPRARSYGG